MTMSFWFIFFPPSSSSSSSSLATCAIVYNGMIESLPVVATLFPSDRKSVVCRWIVGRSNGRSVSVDASLRLISVNSSSAQKILIWHLARNICFSRNHHSTRVNLRRTKFTLSCEPLTISFFSLIWFIIRLFFLDYFPVGQSRLDRISLTVYSLQSCRWLVG